MTALRLLNTESQDKADYLHNQLITDINVPSTYWQLCIRWNILWVR